MSEFEFSDPEREHSLFFTEIRDAFDAQHAYVGGSEHVRKIKGNVLADDGIHGITLVHIVPQDQAAYIAILEMPGEAGIPMAVTEQNATYFGFPDRHVEDDTMAYCRYLITNADWEPPRP